jgi:post-segregation antitoxin (ccd killing protein)
MTDITSLSIPKEIMIAAKDLGINCSKVARDAISTEIKAKSIKNTDIVTRPAVEG